MYKPHSTMSDAAPVFRRRNRAGRGRVITAKNLDDPDASAEGGECTRAGSMVGDMLALRELSRRPVGVDLGQLNAGQQAGPLPPPEPKSKTEVLASKSNFLSEGTFNDEQQM